MTDMICSEAHNCKLLCLGRSARGDGLNCDTGHCELNVHCIPVTVKQPAEVDGLVKALREVEWVLVPGGPGWDSSTWECPWCDFTKSQGHDSICQRQAALKPFEGVEA